MLKKYNSKIDSFLISSGLLYIILPIIIFLCGWVKLVYSIPATIAFLCLFYASQKEIKNKSSQNLFNKKTILFWIISISVIILWVYLSGIGSYVWQNKDYIARNPMFRDLCEQKWPIIIDLAKENNDVKIVCGTDKVGLVYYLCWWLPIALISKIFQLNEIARNFLLFIYAVYGIFLVFYFICRKLSRCSFWVLLCFIFFSGLDIIPYIIFQPDISFIAHLEWWAGFFQYSGNTTLLFWVFNQTIQIWLITILILQPECNNYILALAALSFAYSPWAAIGIIPIAIGLCITRNNLIKNFNPINIITILCMLIFFGSFYMCGTGTDGEIGTMFTVAPYNIKTTVTLYVLFILFEIGIYFLIMDKFITKFELYYVVLIELLIIPITIIRDNKFIMRGSIPALFILSLYITKFLIDYRGCQKCKLRYYLLIIVLCIGSINSIHEINRTVINTATYGPVLQEDIYTFTNIKTNNQITIKDAVKDQFLAYDYEEQFFYKYLAKTSSG